jgi:hypothetical protein
MLKASSVYLIRERWDKKEINTLGKLPRNNKIVSMHLKQKKTRWRTQKERKQ